MGVGGLAMFFKKKFFFAWRIWLPATPHPTPQKPFNTYTLASLPCQTTKVWLPDGTIPKGSPSFQEKSALKTNGKVVYNSPDAI